MLKSKSARLERRICFLDFSSFHKLPVSLAHGPYLHLLRQQHSICKSLSLTLTFLPPSITWKDPCDYTWATQTMQDNFLVSGSLTTSVMSVLPCEVTYPHSWGLGSARLVVGGHPSTVTGRQNCDLDPAGLSCCSESLWCLVCPLPPLL